MQDILQTWVPLKKDRKKTGQNLLLAGKDLDSGPLPLMGEEEKAASSLHLDTDWDAAAETSTWSKTELVRRATDHSLLQALQVLLGLLPPFQLQPADKYTCLWACTDSDWAVCTSLTWVPAAAGSSPGPPSSASRAPPVASRAPAWSSGSGCTQKQHQAPSQQHPRLSTQQLTPAAPWSASPWRPAHLEGCWSASGGPLGETGSASPQHPESTRSVTLKAARLLINRLHRNELCSVLYLFFFSF